MTSDTQFSGVALRGLRIGLSPRLLIGSALILGLAVTALSVRNTQRERDAMTRNMTDRAEALIWALEAGTRTGMGMRSGESRLLQALVEETARQPGIVFIAVVGAAGKIVAHSDPGRVGVADGDAFLPLPEAGDTTAWRTADRDGRSVFEAYRSFTPWRISFHHALRNRSGRSRPAQPPPDGFGQNGDSAQSAYAGFRSRGCFGRGGMHEGAENVGDALSADAGGGPCPRHDVPERFGQSPDASFGTVFVGLDREPFEEALDEDFRNMVFSAVLVAAMGFAGVVSLFWAHTYRRSRRMLKDSQAMAAEVVAGLPLGLLTDDPAGNVTMINPPAMKILNIKHGGQGGSGRCPERSEEPGAAGAGESGAAGAENGPAAVFRENGAAVPLRSIAGMDWEAVSAELAVNGKILEREITLAPGGGRPATVSLSAAAMRNEEGVFLGNLFILRDISEMKRLRAEAQRNERLTALGHLAAGVAHEIRNPLSTIKGVAVYMARRMPPGGREEEAAGTLIAEVDRLDRVVSELLEFARPGVLSTAECSLRELVARALRLADADLKAGRIAVTVEEEPDFPPVSVNGERLTQALLNLFLNAVQAMKAGGELRVAFRRLPGSEFSISVGDTGPGIPEDVQRSLFTPYFTTKAGGTGLGLAIVHQIVEGHGGTIRVTDAAGGGAEFTLTLPVDGKR
jgi:two-component system sensor histidine kinase HydH